MPSDKPALLPSILQMKCPNCRKGHMFVNKSMFPFKDLLKMPDHCLVCGQKMEIEIGFYYGTGYVSYGLSLALFLFNLVWYWAIFGLSYRDNSVYYYLITSIVIVILLQPWLMRISRVLYLYMFVKYGKGTTWRSQE
ncbi:MAG: DUF983 domain-containing protein [Taibaiella sp.]|nr:DUF983 domain-containing protein [Taibaiella sp.]